MKVNLMRPDENGCYLLPLGEAARRLGISRETLYRWVRRGEFPEPIKQGKKSFYALSDLESHITKLKRKLSPSPILS